MKESDWKKFKRLKEICLERFCEDVLAQSAVICSSKDQKSLERYHQLYQLIQNKDKELAGAFDGLSRSKAFMQLIYMYRLGLVEEKQLDEFEDETKAGIRNIAKSFKS